MASANREREREGPPRPSELPAEYRSGSYFSEAQTFAPAGVVTDLPRRSGLGLRTTLTLWLLWIGLCPVLLVLLLSFRLRRQDQSDEALRAAVLLRETLSPDLRDNACEVRKGRLWALRRATGYQLGLYNLHRPVTGTLDAPPNLPWDIVRRTLEGDRSPQLFLLQHGGTAYLAAAVKLGAPPECGSPVLLVLLPRFAVDPHARWTLLTGALGLLLLLLPPVLFLPRHLGGLLSRLHRRVQLIHGQPRDAALSEAGSASQALPLQFPPAVVLDEPSRLLDPGLLSRPDEIGDLSRSFAQILDAMRDNEARLGARVRELTTLHAIGRAISSVLDLEEALHKIVSEVVGVFTARRGALVLVSADMRYSLGAGVRVDPSAAEAVAALGEVLIRRGGRVRIDSLSKDPELAAAARHGGLSGSLLCAPLDQQGKILGVLMITRTRGKPGFNDADLQLLSTVADQASTAISNARLYDEVQRSSEELELRVKERTVDLLMANEELARVVENLHQAQAQLVLSERLAGLGQLVAGVAHEINSPAAAIRGAADALQDNVARMTERARQIADLPLSAADRARFLELCAEVVPHLPAGQLPAPALVRRLGREFAADLGREFAADLFAREAPPADRPADRAENREGGNDGLLDACRTLAELGVADHAVIATLAGLAGQAAEAGTSLSATLCVLVGYLEERTYLYRNAHAIRTAIGQISRIVGALKSYSHLDQARIELTDIHEGLETTLVILHSELKYGIFLTRKYGTVPSIHAYVDELNQVWTNLLHNAVQALQSMRDDDRGGAVRKEIVIETGYEPGLTAPPEVSPSGPAAATGAADGEVWVAIEDSGPGISPEILPRIFEPFFTTKGKGEGTGLGLGIVRQIVTKHGGRIEVSSGPGRTRFTVRLPVKGPAAQGYR